jgi:uncharacterized protein with gpF-like domain
MPSWLSPLSEAATIRAQSEVWVASKKKTRRGKSTPQPTVITRAYRDRLVKLVAQCRPAVAAAVKRFEALQAKRGALRRGAREPHIGSITDAAEAVRRSMAGVRVEFDTVAKKARPGLLAQGVGNKTAAFAVAAVDKSVRGIVSIDVGDLADTALRSRFVRENVSLIKSIPKQLAADIEAELSEAWSVGRDSAVLAARIEQRFGVATNRARLIARDQVATLNSRIAAKRQQQLGDYPLRVEHVAR